MTFRTTGQHCDRFGYDEVIEPGSTLQLGECEWQVLAAPGHDPHSIMLWNTADRVLISADALWQHGFGAIFPEIEGESGFAEQAALLERIAQLGPRLVIPGHGAPFIDVDAALARAHARLAALSTDPARNARHVAKALVKFYLLEIRSLTFEQLVQHLAGARYFHLINERYFGVTLASVSCADRARAGGGRRGRLARRHCRESGWLRLRSAIRLLARWSSPPIVCGAPRRFSARLSIPLGQRSGQARRRSDWHHMQAAVMRTTKATTDHMPANTGRSPNATRRSSSDGLIAASPGRPKKVPLSGVSAGGVRLLIVLWDERPVVCPVLRLPD